ncbi:LADA_0F01244g1_1 [Lachancea dasiensis]|uniref:LADA_0F01244g1_1 n=1 Tax=Lachancea dasiensis TaxID=1072105 RepID=A0A1G4JHY6_9SACH|nr:LADA_0F01244g1_1 [Lachancea dasiensis]
MAQQVSLSIEETNKLRLSLGLKPIEVEVSHKETNSADDNDSVPLSEHESTSKSNATADKLSRLRWNLKRAQSKLQSDVLVGGLKDDDDKDWLNKVGAKKRRQNGPALRKNYQEMDRETFENDEFDPKVKVVHEMSQMTPGSDVILTLQESELDSEGKGDVLVNEGALQDAQQAKNVNLKRLNQARRLGKISVSKGSYEEGSDDNKESGPSLYMVEGRLVGPESPENSPKAPDNRMTTSIYRDTEEKEGDISGPSDFAPVKIKKRKKLSGPNVSSKRSKPVPQNIKVELVDEDSVDAADAADQELEEFLKIQHSANAGERKAQKSAEEIVKEIEEEKRDRSARDATIAGARGFIVDENSVFLSKLQSSLLTKTDPVKFERIDLTPASTIGNAIKGDSVLFSEGEQKKEEEGGDQGDHFDGESNQANFQDGLASTLNFLRDHNAIPPLGVNSAKNGEKSKELEELALKQMIEARVSRERFAQELSEGKVRYTPDELDKIQRLHEQQVSNRNHVLQRERLVSYNPEVKLSYKDSHGNELTTKEAYKKLSQAFHGTRSNRKKFAKAQQKVENRNRQNQSYIG